MPPCCVRSDRIVFVCERCFISFTSEEMELSGFEGVNARGKVVCTGYGGANSTDGAYGVATNVAGIRSLAVWNACWVSEDAVVVVILRCTCCNQYFKKRYVVANDSLSATYGFSLAIHD